MSRLKRTTPLERSNGGSGDLAEGSPTDATSASTRRGVNGVGTEDPAQPPLLEVRGLGKSFAGQWGLRDFDLTVWEGEVHALLGENGSGKSTFIKLLSGYHVRDRGEISIGGMPIPARDAVAGYRLGARFVHQDLGLVGSLTVADNMFIGGGFPKRFGGISSRALARATKAQLDLVELDVDPFTDVERLSPSTKTGVAVARALRADKDAQVRLLVLDEPTATLPEHEVRHLLDIVRAVSRRGIGVVYVTHRLDEVFEIGENVTVLRDGLVAGRAAVADLTRASLIEMLVGKQMAAHIGWVYSDAGISGSAEEAPHADPGGALLEVHELESDRLAGVSFSARAGEIIGFAGITGSGRDSLLGATFGASDRTGGMVTCQGSAIPPGAAPRSVAAGMAYVPAERKIHGGMMEMSARENFSLPSTKSFMGRFGLNLRAERAEARKWFAELSVSPADAIERPLGLFSGGNQQKILLAKWLRRSPKVLLLDEPTQGVDIGARSQIHRRLALVAAEGAAVVISSSDGEELAEVCQVVYVVRKGKIVTALRGAALTEHNISAHSLDSPEAV